VATLEPGTSVEAVRAELGDPPQAGTHDAEGVLLTTLIYGRWVLQFEDGRLTERIKDLDLRPIPAGNTFMWEEKRDRAVDQEVLDLHLGMSMATVRSRLGGPEAIALGRNDPKEETLSYGFWDLRFVDDALTYRQRH
jgi:hypothetical protein